MSITVTIADIRAAGHCVAGAKKWFAANKIPFKAGLKDGWDEETLLASGDALAVKVVEVAKRRLSDG